MALPHSWWKRGIDLDFVEREDDPIALAASRSRNASSLESCPHIALSRKCISIRPSVQL